MDLTAALDTIDHSGLFHDLSERQLPGFVKRWMLSCLQRRFTYTEHNETKSKRRKDDPPHVSIGTDADDLTLMTSGPVVEGLPSQMNLYLEKLSSCLKEQSLTPSAEKLTVTVLDMVQRSQFATRSVNQRSNLTCYKVSLNPGSPSG